MLDLCNSIPKLVVDLGFIDTSVHFLSIDVSQKFKKLFSYYSKCHNIMNSSHYFKDNDIQELGKYLTNFFDFTLVNFSLDCKLQYLNYLLLFLQYDIIEYYFSLCIV